MKSVIEQLANYKSVHLNKNNIKSHIVGVPMIIWSIALLLNTLSFEVTIFGHEIVIGLAIVAALVVLLYYFALHVPLALMIALLFGPLVISTQLVVDMGQPVLIALGVFFIGWVIQFIGHAYERAKPAFIDDINQLLIGPLFLIAELYFALGLNKEMADEVHQKAVEKRKLFEQAKAV
ncbi:Mpo1 family 2-hydroxy fatty acid dioxygenase [Thalassotalea montiporae]